MKELEIIIEFILTLAWKIFFIILYNLSFFLILSYSLIDIMCDYFFIDWIRSSDLFSYHDRVRFFRFLIPIYKYRVWMHAGYFLSFFFRGKKIKMLFKRKVFFFIFLCLGIISIVYRRGHGSSIPTLLMLLVFFLSGKDPYRIENPKKVKRGGFILKGKLFDLPINRPEEGIEVLGGPGSGKSESVIKPLIAEAIKQGRSGIIYDFDFVLGHKNPSLSEYAHAVWSEKSQKTNFFCINFSDPDYSHRFNPVEPSIIKNRAMLRQVAQTLFSNISPGISSRKDFWAQSALSLFEATIIFFHNQYPRCCTVPHAISLLSEGSRKVLSLLETDEEARKKIQTLLDSQESASEMVMGVVKQLETLLGGLVNEHIYYVMSGHDVPSNISDRYNPAIVSIGNVPEMSATFSPLVAMIIKTLTTSLYHKGNPSFLIVDELPTIFLPNLSEIPATMRKYGVATIFAMQSTSQLQDTYGDRQAAAITESLKNKLISACEYRSAEYASKLMGKKEIEDKNRLWREDIFTPQQVSSLDRGEFIGKVVGSDKIYFHTHLSVDRKKRKYGLPLVNRTDTQHTKKMIEEDIRAILEIL